MAQLSRDPQTQAEEVYYLHTDHLGAVVKATDAGQTLVWDAMRRPFGERTVSVAGIEVLLGFPGQYYDEETNNYYNYFRDYDPTTGRYLQSDPIGLAGGLNTYAYVLGNPIIFFDPYGLTQAQVDATVKDILDRFPRVSPRGDIMYQDGYNMGDAGTDWMSADIYISPYYRDHDLTCEEMHNLFKDLIHEMMHSTDNILDRYRDSHEKDGQMTPNHQSIYDRADYEAGDRVPFQGTSRDNLFSRGPLWGLGPNPVPLNSDARKP